MKKVVLTPNPYRDSGFQTVRDAEKVLNEVGVECRICLPFEVDRAKEFAPIKNKTGVDSVESARAMLEKLGFEL